MGAHNRLPSPLTGSTKCHVDSLVLFWGPCQAGHDAGRRTHILSGALLPATPPSLASRTAIHRNPEFSPEFLFTVQIKITQKTRFFNIVNSRLIDEGGFYRLPVIDATVLNFFGVTIIENCKHSDERGLSVLTCAWETSKPDNRREIERRCYGELVLINLPGQTNIP